MNENTPNNSETPGQQQTSGQSRDTADLVTELREMGQQLEAAFRAAIESERAKQLQRDLAGGVREMSTQIQEALKSVQTNPRVQQAEERGREAIGKAQQSQVVQDVQETVISGIGQLNLQLRKLVERLEQNRTQAASTPTQHVPVENDPATGETTRLNDQDQTRL